MKDLSLFLLDIAQNSIRACSSLISIRLIEEKGTNTFLVQVQDDGTGMPQDALNRATDPFYTTRTTRSVGLGLSFLKSAAERTGGTFSLSSVLNQGTSLTALFHTDHIDMVPLGDLTATFVSILSGRTCFHLDIFCKSDEKSFDFSTRDIENFLGESLDLSDPELYAWCSDTLRDRVESVFGHPHRFHVDFSAF